MSAQLLVVAPTTVLDERAPVTRLGGRPLVPASFDWPTCGDCQRPLQFLAQLASSNDLLLLFSCHATSCVVGGGPDLPSNRVVRVPAVGSELRDAPEQTPTLPLTPVEFVSFDQPNRSYDEARFDPGRFVFGMMGGEPDSVSGHVPHCTACARPMRFVASLEEGSLFNFAGVQAFVFACEGCTAAQLFVDDFF
ncbi:MAG: DUF1963 domain-containing protein [Myxococcaceae bacterium]